MRDPRPIVYDATHLVSRLLGPTATGIDFVDRAYARYLSRESRLACGLHYGAFAPHRLSPDFVALLSQTHERKFAAAVDPQWEDLRAWLLDETREAAPNPADGPARCSASDLALMLRARLRDDRRLRIPEGAIYLNVAQHGFEFPRLFSWLDRRPDVLPVFLVHDVLPLDCPEFFRAGYEALFRARFDLVLRRARAVIATASCTAARIAEECRRQGRPAPPICVEPLASPLSADAAGARPDPELAAARYFVCVATIEPRKNQALLLDVWRDLAARGPAPPKLALVGGRGLGSGPALDGARRSRALAPLVRAVSGLSAPALRSLIANARALLAPSFAEGYGIPLVEALSLGTPVVCSDIPIFREVTQGAARFLSPIDGVGWRATIEDFSAPRSPARAAALRATDAFRAPDWNAYFAGIETFLAGL
ncbi:MAG TPA: glycosyltransferase family 1 protein [Methylocystis sp.]|nr:glycosyltransferase family 1 protein [Methylocystis sp.]